MARLTKVYQDINFLKNVSLNVNPMHYCNEMESLKFINEILITYIGEEREKLNLPNQKALIVFGVFRGQLTKSDLKLLDDNNFVVIFVPTNITHLYRPLDLMVSEDFKKKFLKKKFNE